MNSSSHKTPDPVLEASDTCQAALDETSRILAETHETLLEMSRKLDAIIKHLDVPYKPPAGFVKE